MCWQIEPTNWAERQGTKHCRIQPFSTYCKLELKHKALNITSTKNSQNGGMTRSCRHGKEPMNKRIAATYLTMSKHKLRLVIGILTGHCQLNKLLLNKTLDDILQSRGKIGKWNGETHSLHLPQPFCSQGNLPWEDDD